MDKSNQHRVPTLARDEAFKLWHQGVEAWNSWVEMNPKYNIDFSNLNFIPIKKNPHNNEEYIPFDGFRFPEGNVNFKGAKFRGGFVTFSGVNFDNTSVDFSRAIFDCIRVSFVGTKFGRAAHFGAIDFNDTSVDFRDAKFFGNIAHFTSAKFGKGFVHFGNTDFGNANVDFRSAQFGEGNTYFDSTDFSKATLNFKNAKFAGGDIGFIKTKFPTENLSFELIDCKGCFIVSDVNKKGAISFKGASFYNIVSFERFTLDTVLDLVGTKLSHQLSLHGFSCRLRRNRDWRNLWFKIACDTEDIARLNRLKELAENNKHHALALRLHADEHRAQRWNTIGLFGSFIDIIFSAVCNYGQSIKRPFLIWLATIPMFAFFYAKLSEAFELTCASVSEVLILSATNSLPFITSSKAMREIILTRLFDMEVQLNYLSLIVMSQGIVSVIFIFLIGLGLRNRFRL
tara:strand:+ start:588 stop:1955 length:1368 start_codon:yes stop_codon:yes gene_type:complete